jgi:hypothetical protein
MAEELALFAVQNNQGQWFRAKGFGGHGNTWVDDFQKAKVYPKIGQARSRITFFATNYPTYPAPKLVKLVISEVMVIDETDRVEKAKKKRVNREARQELRRKQYSLKLAQDDLERAQKRLQEASTAASHSVLKTVSTHLKTGSSKLT